MSNYLGIEIGGTKLQVGLGPDDGKLRALWRGDVDVPAGPEGIRRQILAAVPALLASAGVERSSLRAVGVGFGGPVEDTRTVIKSHQIAGWDNFPLGDWVGSALGLPAVLGNDADVAGLAEALHGAGKGLSPIFYVTIGSGIGGGLVVDGEAYRGCGRGAAEVGHLRLRGPEGDEERPLEQWSSGWALEQRARELAAMGDTAMLRLAGGDPGRITGRVIARAVEGGDLLARRALLGALVPLADALCHVIALLCPRRIVVGGGVSLMGEAVLFEPLRRLVAERVFEPFAGLTEIVPAALGEEVVVHGAIALARKATGISGTR